MLSTSRIACPYILFFKSFPLIRAASLLGLPIFSFIRKHSRIFSSSIFLKFHCHFLGMDLKFIMLAVHVLLIWEIRVYFLRVRLFFLCFLCLEVGHKLNLLIFGSSLFCSFSIFPSPLCLCSLLSHPKNFFIIVFILGHHVFKY